MRTLRTFGFALLGISALFVAACSPSTDTAPVEVTEDAGGHDAEAGGHDDAHSDGDASHDAHSAEPGDVHAAAALSGDYPLANCPVTGTKLGAMGDIIVETIDGREVRFCCAGCPAKFKASKVEYFAKMDLEIEALGL